jgi:hypothetical protein
MDRLLGELGAEQIHERGEGDELCGQDQSFNDWAHAVFKVRHFLEIWIKTSRGMSFV